jgi:hypothetical protein
MFGWREAAQAGMQELAAKERRERKEVQKRKW